MAGIDNINPGYNSPQRYQNFEEGGMNAVQGMADRQVGLGNAMMGMGAQQAGQWGNRANNMYGLAAGIASRAPAWYADRAAVNSNEAFDESKGVQDRALSRMGINPNSGRFVGLQTQWGLARAAAEAGAKTRAQEEAAQRQFGQTEQLAGMANGQAGVGRQMMEGAGREYNAAGNDYNTLANEYGRMAGSAQRAKMDEQNASQNKIDQMIDELYGLMGRSRNNSVAVGTSTINL